MRVLTDYILADDCYQPKVAVDLGCPFTLAIDGVFVPDQPAIVEIPDAYEPQVRALGYVVL